MEDWTGVDVTILPEHYKYNEPDKHRVLHSISTYNQEYFFVEFGDSNGYNVNIIPHRQFNDTYHIVAQRSEHSIKDSVFWAEITCLAKFMNGRLRCSKELSLLPISATFGEARDCPTKMKYLNLAIGPHDARVFWGPKKPYIIYGSNSDHPCMGMWVQDFRLLVDWGFDTLGWEEFKYGTEIMRPDAWSYMEKNWFLFWDKDGVMYAHHDIFPKRVYAQLHDDGTVGRNLAGLAKKDAKCMADYMPKKAKILEAVHQATNSLSITLCKRSDPKCIPDDTNTFLFTIFHHKTFYAYHGNYEPFVMTFHRTKPFAIHGISTRPLWINGRTRAGPGNRPSWLPQGDNWDDRQSEMFYVTSMAWATHGQRYHGYLDDVLFISFGIEDKLTAAIDVYANDLFIDLGLC